MKVTKKHFDRAVKQKWSSTTCVIAQLAKDNDDIQESRLGCMEIATSSAGDYIPPYNSIRAREIMEIFDRSFRYPGDEKSKPELVELRKSLPIEIGG